MQGDVGAPGLEVEVQPPRDELAGPVGFLHHHHVGLALPDDVHHLARPPEAVIFPPAVPDIPGHQAQVFGGGGTGGESGHQQPEQRKTDAERIHLAPEATKLG